MVQVHDISWRLNSLMARRQLRIRRSALALIGFGLVLVYSDVSMAATIGTACTLIGMLVLVLMLAGVFDVEQRQVALVAEVIERLCDDEVSLQLLWDDVVRSGRLGAASWSPTYADLVTLHAIQRVRQRRFRKDL